MLKILTVPNTILTSETKKVEQFDGSFAKLVKEMDQTLTAQTNPQGVGLAAPQIGKNIAIFIVKPTPEAKTEVFVNPKIIKVEAGNPEGSGKYASNPQGSEGKKRKHKPVKLEGCLSIPKIWGTIARSGKILLEFQDLTGYIHKKLFSGFKATIIQHELDHLIGILFTQRALEQNSQLFEEEEGKLMPLRFQKERVNA